MSSNPPLVRNTTLTTMLLMGWSLAHAQNTSAPADDALTWKGITLYGVVDVALQYDTHSAPGNDYLTYTVGPFVSRYSNGTIVALTSNGLSASRIGLSGLEPITGDWSAVFRLETYFDPTSGQIIDTLHSLTQQNGVPLNKQTSSADSSNDGEPFQTAVVGVSSRTYGTATFGRQTTIYADGVVKYDILEDGVDAANAFSLIVNSRAAGGAGDTEDSRLDHSIKYTARYDHVHAGLLYQVSNANSDANTALQAQIGYDAAGASVDVYFSKKYDAISAAALTAAQVSSLPAGTSLDHLLSGTISDNTAYAVMGSYSIGRVKFSGGYDHLRFADPSHPLSTGSMDVNGYILEFTNNGAYAANNKVLEIFWAGAKYYLQPNFYVAASYYGYRQNSYGATSCSNNTAATCSGTENAIGALADYRFTRHFDTYFGGAYSQVNGGLSTGYLKTSNTSVSAGLRFTF